MKKIAVLGTGMVGNVIGTKLVQLGYMVSMGSRTANNEKALAWVKSSGSNASTGTFSDAAAFGDIIFNCTKGDASIEILENAGKNNFSGKTIIDVANPLDFSKGMPPTLIPELVNTNSLGEEIQRILPEANVVKSLNMVNCEVMVNAAKGGGNPTMFICGNNPGAKTEVKFLLEQFGWLDIIDLGDITAARGMEMMLPVWLRTWMATGNGYFSFKITSA